VIDRHGQRDFYPCLRKFPLTGIRVPAPVDGSVDKSVEDGRRPPIFGGDENKRPALHLAAGVQNLVQIRFQAKIIAAVILSRRRSWDGVLFPAQRGPKQNGLVSVPTLYWTPFCKKSYPAAQERAGLVD
jgi:hypothetical protein